MMISISVADLTNPLHAEATLDLLNHYANNEMGGGQELTQFVKDNLVKEFEKRQTVHVILAFDGENPVGLAILMEGFSTFSCMPLLNIHDIFVSSAYRGQGISKLLLSKAEQIAKQLGCCKLTLEVLEGNKLAQAAYRACGFEGYELSPNLGKALFWQKKLTY
ncbi:MAG: GNAT family N-acetyltransferase [Methylococcaceae bacterium]|jgi:ribosomal protein S18 acetylase RimI-like enzyme